MNRRTFKWSLILIIAATIFIVSQLERTRRRSASQSRNLIVGISPYQDLAMLTTYKNLKLDEKYGVDLEIKTLAWEDVQISLASAGKTIDIGFGSLIEFVTKNEALNKGSSDPLVFVFPAYVFKGGGFVTFRKDVPNIDRYAESSRELGSIPRETVEKFLSFKIGAQKNSMWDMMIYRMCDQHKVDVSTLKISDIPAADALLAAESGSLRAAGRCLGARAAGSSSGGGTARPLPPLPPIPESRTAAYPFAMQPQFQAHAPRTRVSPRQRLLYGILAAIVSIMVVIGIVVALQAVDRAQRG
jgi:ABC-type nitrate/sulfonate/bicarbonate transport system substrate-binding protein